MKEMTLMNAIKDNKLLSIFSFSFIVIFIFLGIWQLERADQKTVLMEEFQTKQTQAPEPLSQSSLEWSRVYVEGFYDPTRQILIDNQIDKSKAGYKIFTPFHLNERKLIMIDRGWIPQGNTRNDLPDIAFISPKTRVVGTLIVPEAGVVTGDELITNLWPKVSQTKSLKTISSGFSEEIYSKVLVLDSNSKFSAKYIPIEPFAITPIKHYGYAGQWFAMSIVLLGMFLYALRRES